MKNLAQRWLGPMFLFLPVGLLLGGGSGLNVAVVVNQASSNSVRLGNYYCEKRQVPPQNVIRINWTGGNVEWTRTQFQNTLANPLNAALAERRLTNQIDYVLLSMDIPYRVMETNGANGTTSTLFYGFKPDTAMSPPLPNSCSLPPATLNQYAGSECPFRMIPPGLGSTSNLLAFMLTASNLTQAKRVVDQGVASDYTFPTQTVVLGKSTDVFRNIRYLLFDNAIFNAKLLGNPSILRTNTGATGTPNVPGPLLGYQNGWQGFGMASNLFAPGAMGDNLTSFGGRLFETPEHTRAIDFLIAGASGSYGTVVEPCAHLGKFPSPQNYFYQARGFSLAECYYQSVTNPYQGILVGDPLAAPFAKPASGTWLNLPTNAVLKGTTNLTLQFTAGDANRPVQQVDLFLDGKFVQTLTNIAPAEGNKLFVAINGHVMSNTVPAGATIYAIATALTSVLNQFSNTNATKVRAVAYGDRIELQSFQLGRSGNQISISVSNANGSAGALTTFICASRTNFLDTVAHGLRNFYVTNAPLSGDYLQLVITKTNGSQVTLAVTNTPPLTNTSGLTQRLVDLVNSNADLQLPDGVVAEDFIGYEGLTGKPLAEFNLRARAAGWNEAQIQASLSAGPTLVARPNGTNRLDENLGDLQPRNHLYITAGTTNLLFTFPFNTANHPDGWHELTAVAYEGSHVRTQKRLVQNVRIQNTPLSATFTCNPCDTNTAVEATVQFTVVANTNNITNIVLYSTGGALASASNQSSATFVVAGTNLDIGLHPFYAVVTRNDGSQYRTETKWIRLVGPESPFPLRIAAPPPVLTWTATAGRRYEILGADCVTNAFAVRDSLTPSNAAARWADTNPAPDTRFYRVRSAH